MLREAGFALGLLIVLALVLAAEFVNGWTDAPNAIATVVSTRVLSPGLAVIMAAGAAIVLASALGIPLSTTHTINTSIMGVGSARRLSAVRWGVVGEVVAAWVLTFPVCALIAWLTALVMQRIF